MQSKERFQVRPRPVTSSLNGAAWPKGDERIEMTWPQTWPTREDRAVSGNGIPPKSPSWWDMMINRVILRYSIFTYTHIYFTNMEIFTSGRQPQIFKDSLAKREEGFQTS